MRHGIVPRDLPRRSAPLLLAAYDITVGVTGLELDRYHLPAYRQAQQFMSLNAWGVSFIVLGVLVLAGMASPRAAIVTAAVAIGWWTFWTAFLVQAVGPGAVSPRGIAINGGVGFLHILVMPYRRDRRLDTSRHRDDRT